MIGEFVSVLAAVCWASSTILSRIAGLNFSPVALNNFRNLLALGAFSLTLFLAGVPLIPEALSARELWLLGASGVVGIALGDTLILASLNRLGAGLHALAECLYAPFVLLLSFLIFGEKLPLLGLLGTALIIIGIYLGTAPEGANPALFALKIPRSHWGSEKALGVLFAVMAAFCYAVSALTIKSTIDKVHWIWAITFRYLTGCLGLILWGLWQKKTKELFSAFEWGPSLRFTFSASFLGAFMASLTWVYGMKMTTVTKASVLNQLSTIFTLILAAWLLKEKFTVRRLIAGVLSFAGALMVTLG